MIKNVNNSSCEVPIILIRFEWDKCFDWFWKMVRYKIS